MRVIENRLDETMIQISGLSKTFGGDRGPVRVLDNIELNVPEGSLFTLLGPSGCGKTTTLRCVAGLEKPTGGEIHLNGQTVYSSSARVWVPAERRHVGMVFQSYAIWPHMTVIENVVYPLEAKRVGTAERARRAKEVLEKVGLAELADRPATQLSGGQQQRVALARALVARPQVLLFDEPLSNLDAKLREQLRIEIVTLQKEFGITSLYVTHDQEEALAISDQIAIMRDGEILEIGDPATLYETPAYKFSAAFLGLANFIDGRVVSAMGDSVEISTPIGAFKCGNPHRLAVGSECNLFFRPESVWIEAPNASIHVNRLQVQVQSRMYLGHTVDLRLKAGDYPIRAKVPPRQIPEMGSTAFIGIDPDSCIALAAEPAQYAQQARQFAA